MTFLDFFSGIGGFRLGLERAGHKCVGHCEIDKYANASYNAMHQPKEGEWYGEDITKISARELPKADIWCFGFPCQDISIAGKQKGMRIGTRSGLFYSVTALLREIEKSHRPSILFIENVKNLLSINGGWDFAQVLIEMDEIGYDAEWQVLNSKDFGVPQNRERLFIIGHLRGRSRRKVFPITRSSGQTIVQVGNIKEGKSWNNPQTGRVYSTEGISPCLNACGGGQHEPKILIDKSYNQPRIINVANCLTAREDRGISNRKAEGTAVLIRETTKNSTLTNNYRIRKLTPKECWRLQGFPDAYFEKASKVCSDTQLYKQAGNAVTVNVITYIGERL